jgi:hypothetical protein
MPWADLDSTVFQPIVDCVLPEHLPGLGHHQLSVQQGLNDANQLSCLTSLWYRILSDLPFRSGHVYLSACLPLRMFFLCITRSRSHANLFWFNVAAVNFSRLVFLFNCQLPASIVLAQISLMGSMFASVTMLNTRDRRVSALLSPYIYGT